MTAESLFEIRVACYCGYRGEETPRRFYINERPIEIAEVLDRWLAPEHRYFKVRCAAGDRYILRHNTRTDRWQLTLFESRAKPDGL